MDIFQLIESSIRDARTSLWPSFAPEIVIASTILTILIVRLFTWGTRLQKIDALVVTVLGCAVGLYVAQPGRYLTLDGAPSVVAGSTGSEDVSSTQSADEQTAQSEASDGASDADGSLAARGAAVMPGAARYERFSGMLIVDSFTVYVRVLLLGFTLLFAIFAWLTRTPDREDGADFYCLVLGGILGMCLMASANHLLMVFLAVEMASVPSYVLAGALRNRRDSSEAALKYAVFGAGAAGVMLYGISLLAGLLNSVHLPTMAHELATRLPGMNGGELLVAALGGIMLMVGLAFKLSAVPFHFWCPDVFTGATAEVNAYLSVASKAAALALLVRVAIGFGVAGPIAASPAEADTAVAQLSSTATIHNDSVSPTGQASPTRRVAALQTTDGTESGDTSAATAASDPLARVRTFIAVLVGIIAAVTCTFGNLAAYGQTNIKRMMAYSTIAHAGYMMLPVPAAILAAQASPEVARSAVSALALYMFMYLFMNLGAFTLIAFLRNSLGSEEIEDYSGLIRTAPIVVVLFAVVLFSLVGLPPLAGFIGKFAIFASLVGAYDVSGQAILMTLLVIGGINTAISLFYYLRVVKVMTFDPESEAVRRSGAILDYVRGVYAAAVILPVFVFGIYWDRINEITRAATQQLFY